MNTTEDLALILDIVDKVKISQTGSKDCLKSIGNRLKDKNPHIAMQALILLDYCINNCGKKFHMEIASRDFVKELKSILNSSKINQKFIQKIRFFVKKWTENEFKDDPSLSLIPSLYETLKSEGCEFNDPDETTTNSKVNTADLQRKEAEDLRKAMAESLILDSKKKSNSSTSAKNQETLYPSVSGLATSTSIAPTVTEAVGDDRKVRALYDFEAAEDNELTFKAGEIIILIDDSDQHWWKGSNHRGEGLFPANFATKDLNEKVTSESSTTVKKTVQFNGEVEVQQYENTGQLIESTTVEQPSRIDEHIIDKALKLLHEADAGPDGVDTAELIEAEEKSKMMQPLIDNELEAIDKRYNALCELNSTVTAAMQLYHHLMRTAPRPQIPVDKIQHPVTNFQQYGQVPSQLPPQMNQQLLTSQMTSQSIAPQMNPQNLPVNMENNQNYSIASMNSNDPNSMYSAMNRVSNNPIMNNSVAPQGKIDYSPSHEQYYPPPTNQHALPPGAGYAVSQPLL